MRNCSFDKDQRHSPPAAKLPSMASELVQRTEQILNDKELEFTKSPHDNHHKRPSENMATALRDYLSGHHVAANRNETCFLNKNPNRHEADFHSEQYHCEDPVSTPESDHSSEHEHATRVNGWSAKAVFSPVLRVASKPKALVWRGRVSPKSPDLAVPERHQNQPEIIARERWSTESDLSNEIYALRRFDNSNFADKWPPTPRNNDILEQRLERDETTIRIEQWPSRSPGALTFNNSRRPSNTGDNVINPSLVLSPEQLVPQNEASHNFCQAENSQYMAYNGRRLYGKQIAKRRSKSGIHGKDLRRRIINRYKDKNSYCAEIAGILLRKGSLPLAEIYDMYEEAGLDAKRPSASSWKNSIRHNLSLHECFIKVPCVGQGFNRWAVHPKWVRHFQRLTTTGVSKGPLDLDIIRVPADVKKEEKPDEREVEIIEYDRDDGEENTQETQTQSAKT